MSEIIVAEASAIAPQTQTEMGQFMEMLERAARDPSVDVAKMGALLDMQERILNKKAVSDFNAAYLAAKLEMPRIKKDGVVEYAVNKNQPDGPKKEAFRFATIENIEDVIAPIEQKYGFAHLYDSAPRAGDGGGITTTITLMHRGGHSITSSFSAGLDTSGGKSNLQGMHSSHSLAKRVCLMSIWNIVYEGKDDGGVASGLKFITDDQKQELVALMRETKADVTKFLRFYGIASLDEMEFKSFLGAKNALIAKQKSESKQ